MSGHFLGLTEIQHNLVRRGLDSLRVELRNRIAEITYSKERVEEGSHADKVYDEALVNARRDIEEIDSLASMLNEDKDE